MNLFVRSGWYESTDLWSPRLFTRFILPYVKREAALAHEPRTLYGHIMTSGQLPLLEMLMAAGVDVLIGIDPVQGKGMDLPTLKDKVAGRMSLWGGVNGFVTMKRGWRAAGGLWPPPVDADAGGAYGHALVAVELKGRISVVALRSSPTEGAQHAPDHRRVGRAGRRLCLERRRHDRHLPGQGPGGQLHQPNHRGDVDPWPAEPAADDHPESFGNPFADDPIDGWITTDLIDSQNASFGPHSAREVPGLDERLPPRWRMGVGRIRTPQDAKTHLDGYDTGIRYADHHVGLLVEELKQLGIYDETAIIVSADHGENQGELNVWGDHQTADHVCNRVPLVVRWPGVTDGRAGQVHTGFHDNLDLTATLADLAGAEAPDTWDGDSFAPALRGQADGGRDELILSQGAWSCQRSVRWANWLLIRTYHTGLKHFPEYMLFDIDADPHETTNLAGKRPDLLGEGLRRLDAWLARRMGDSLRGDPFWSIVRSGGPLHTNENDASWQVYLQRLRATGRGHHAEPVTVVKAGRVYRPTGDQRLPR